MTYSKLKVQCEKCKKKYRKVKVQKSRYSGKKLCTFCRKSEITNKFYIPQRKYDSKGKIIGNYIMTDTEKRLLRSNLMSRGMSFKQADYEIAKKCGILKDMKKRQQARAIHFSYQRIEAKKKQEAFVKGLRQ